MAQVVVIITVQIHSAKYAASNSARGMLKGFNNEILIMVVVQVRNNVRRTFVTHCFFYRIRFLRNGFTSFQDFVQF